MRIVIFLPVLALVLLDERVVVAWSSSSKNLFRTSQCGPVCRVIPSRGPNVFCLRSETIGRSRCRIRQLAASQVDDTEIESNTISQEDNSMKNKPISTKSSKERLIEAVPKGKLDELDKLILGTAIPNMINLGVVPVVNAVDTFWVGRLGLALALAGQAAANQASFTLYFLIAFLPNITAPLVASAVASGDSEDAQKRVCESIFLCTVLGILGTAALVAFPRAILSKLVLPAGAPAMEYAAPYLRWRALGMVPSLIAATGFAAYRGMLNTVTPLKVSLATNGLNLILDPLCIFMGRMGFVGAAVATAASEAMGGLTYMKLLMRRNLVRLSRLLKPPAWSSLAPLLRGGAAMLIRQLALNVGFLVATRRSQLIDPSGVSGAAYGIVMQVYSIGILLLVAMQSTAAAILPARMAAGAKEDGDNGLNKARQCADRLIGWSSALGILLGLVQYFVAVPLLVPLFSTLPEVRAAAQVPSQVASLIHVVNGPVLAGEGILMGLGRYKELAMVTAGGMVTLLAGCLFSPFGKRLDGILWSILLSSFVFQIGILWDIYKVGPLSGRKTKK